MVRRLQLMEPERRGLGTRITEAAAGLRDGLLRENKVLPPVLAALALIIFAWLLAGVLIGGPGNEQRVARQAAQPGAAQSPRGGGGSPQSPAPGVENRDNESLDVYESKDPFRELIPPADAAGGSTTGGDTTGSNGGSNGSSGTGNGSSGGSGTGSGSDANGSSGGSGSSGSGSGGSGRGSGGAGGNQYGGNGGGGSSGQGSSDGNGSGGGNGGSGSGGGSGRGSGGGSGGGQYGGNGNLFDSGGNLGR